MQTVWRRAGANTLWAVLAVPLALLGFFVVLVTLVIGGGLSITIIGLPLLAGGGRLARGLAGLQRRLARRVLGLVVQPPPPLRSSGGLLAWLQAALRDPVAWRARAYLLGKPVLAVLGGYLTVFCWLYGLWCLTTPIWWSLSGPGRASRSIFFDLAAFYFRGGSRPGPLGEHRLVMHAGDSFYFDSWPRMLLVALIGLVLLALAPWMAAGTVAVDRFAMRRLLGPGGNAERLRQLETARTLVVEDSAARLRRIERDLHDGAQVQLSTLAMSLGQAKEKLERRPDVPYDPDGALRLVDAAQRHAQEALTELRDLARGIHPPALDLGLESALSTLAGRSAVPVSLRVELPARPARALETIAYFSVAELLANVAKHSRAGQAGVSATVADGMLRLRVEDDGVGGAVSTVGSGLAGLAERVRAVDGTLQVHSPPGGPTMVTVELPLR